MSDPDDAPELTEEMAAALRPARDFPELARALEACDVIALDAEVAERLRSEGGDVERRANALLRKAVGLD